MDMFIDHKSLKYLFTKRDFNIRQWRWLEFLKDYDMSTHYNLGKANVVADALRRLRIGSIAHIDDGKKKLVKDVQRLHRLGVQLMASTNRGVSIHPSSKSSFVVEVYKGQHLDPVFWS